MGDQTTPPGTSSASAALGGPITTINDQDDGIESTYHLKWIQWNSGKIPIVMQSRNGPCPLIATMNVLLLREKVKLPTMLEQITAHQLLTYLGECVMDCVLSADIQKDENAILNLEQNIHDAMEILPKLKTGLDVNIRFTGITDFEYTPECVIFDLLRIPLYHGWLSDPSLIELQNAIGNQSYNQIVDNIITNKNSAEPDILAKVLMAEEFLERTASQLTQHGLYELRTKIKENEIGILFRNNHFLTLFKRGDDIYTLVTDHGYLTEDNIIWETLDNVEGVGRFFDSNFQVSEVTNRQVSEFSAIDQRQQQLVNDYLMALSLKEEEAIALGKDNEAIATAASTTTAKNAAMTAASTCSEPEDDFEFAKRLQEEEDRLYSLSTNRAEGNGFWTDVNNPKSDISTDPTSDRGIDSRIRYKEWKPRFKPHTGASNSSWDEPSSPSLVVPSPSQPESQLSQAQSHPEPQPSSSEPTAVPPVSSEITTDTDNNEIHHARKPSPTFDPQNDSRPLSSHRPSNRRLKSEKNSKESNCIVN